MSGCFARDQAPLVVGHRGVRRPGVAENTPSACAAAVAAGAHWVELDVRRSADGVAVVRHDPTLPDGRALVDLSSDALAGAGVWRLSDVIAGLPPLVGVDVELKNLPGEPDDDPTHSVARMAAEVLTDVARPLLVSSFNPLTAAAAVAALDGVAGGFVHVESLALPRAAQVAAEFGLRALCSRRGAPGLDVAGVAAVHDIGLDVMVWTVNDPREAARLAAAGIDALCTDDPAVLGAL